MKDYEDVENGLFRLCEMEGRITGKENKFSEMRIKGHVIFLESWGSTVVPLSIGQKCTLGLVLF